MRTITVKGEGTISVKPDFIILTISITSKNKVYEAAMEHAATRIRLLECAVADCGFEKNDLKTADFRVSTEYENKSDSCGNYQRIFTGYVCAYRFKLSFDFNAKRLSDVLSRITSDETNPTLQIVFTVKHPEAVSESLLCAASANAREKAEILCRASGVTLGALSSIDYRFGDSELFSRTQYEIEDGVRPLMAGRCQAPEITPDDITVRDTATFVWEIA